MAERKSVLLRLDPAVHEALARWASDDMRSLNAQIELLLRESLKKAGRAPRQLDPLPKRGRPKGAKSKAQHENQSGTRLD